MKGRLFLSPACTLTITVAITAVSHGPSNIYAAGSGCIEKNLQNLLDLKSDREHEQQRTAKSLSDSAPARAIEVYRVRNKYPEISKHIDSVATRLRQNAFMPKANTLDEIPGFSPLETSLDQKPDPKIIHAILAVWNRMNDPQAFAQYIKVLAEDVAVEMRRQDNVKSIRALKEGKLTGTSVLKVLLGRQKAKGETQLYVVKTLDVDVFHETAARGPFLDKAFKDSEHSMTVHLLQRDFVDDVVWEATQGHPELFWRYIHSPGPQRKFWELLFDRPQSVSSPASPEWHFMNLVDLFDHR